ncbi:MAG: GTPase HflX [Planctomycetaceae bacterium]|nr:GTPase HflX [Planctomycetaceae bacterium]
MKIDPRDAANVTAEPAVLVGVRMRGSRMDFADPLGELRALAETAGARVVGELLQNREAPSGRTYLGKGKVEELVAMVGELGAGVVIFDNELSPSQIQALEEEVKVKVIDRSELILDIFANRATTREAQLQVEIAQLEYTAPRLRAMWSHLGQVTGGAPVGVGTRGPGEQQLEIDRRLVSRRLVALKRELEDVQIRKAREVAERRAEHFTVGIVGYTNAGKSTLFNALTRGGAYAADKLFATLMTRVERWNVGGANAVLLSDTVGFIRDLPHHLVASFRATLEDAIHAHALLIVLDASDREAPMQLETVRDVLEDVGANTQPRFLVLNKCDRLAELPQDERDALRTLAEWQEREPGAIPISAVTGAGFDELRARILALVTGGMRRRTLRIPIRAARLVDAVEKRCAVHERRYVEAEDGTPEVELVVEIGDRQIEALLPLGEAFLVDGVDARPKRAAWGGAAGAGSPKRRPPHLVDPRMLDPDESADR